jgi:uncharacterized protein YecE (DUF72 family)
MVLQSAVPNFYSGLSGLQLPVPKYLYPSEHKNSSRLTYYSTFFSSIEINSSFYKIPMKSTVARWASSVNDYFKFTFKLFREVTHSKNLNFDESHIEKFMQSIMSCGTRNGCLLIQFPPGLKKENIAQLEKILTLIKIADPADLWNIAVEFRNKGWYNDDVYCILNAYNASLVIQDMPASATPFIHTSSKCVYVRFHGPTGNYRGSYTDALLLEYTEYIKEWLGEGKIVYAYFNNTAGDAFNNLTTLNNFLHSR